jgi:hypothetical protein
VSCESGTLERPLVGHVFCKHGTHAEEETMRNKILAGCLALALLAGAPSRVTAQAGPPTAHPVLFATQVPVGGFASVTSVFGNHATSPDQVPRGGDLVIRYPDGTLRFLTQEAGFGASGMQGATAIAVREPCVHWSGTKALFAMLVGAPSQQYQVATFYWQIYEVTGLAQGATASIRRIAGQPATFNNVSPIYATDGRILFTSDRPPSGAPTGRACRRASEIGVAAGLPIPPACRPICRSSPATSIPRLGSP